VKNKIGVFGLIIGFLLSSNTVMASPQIWEDVEPRKQVNNLKVTLAKQVHEPLKARTLALDMAALKKQLNINTSTAAKAINAIDAQPIIEIPLPDGGMVRVTIKKNQIFAPEIAKKHPNIQSWSVTGKDDKGIAGVIDTTENGFHAMLLMPDGDIIFIDPDKHSDQYLSFSKQQNTEHFHNSFQCKVHTKKPLLTASPANKSVLGKSLEIPARNIIIYRLAIAATGEYTQYHGSADEALSAISTTINRVNEIYQRDLGIKFQLVGGKNIIYTNPNNDPYTNNDLSSLKLENVDNLNNFGVLGSTQYDIGHVFSGANLGGLANLAAVCDNSRKAGGASGLSISEGEAFNIDVVAHEIGHQLGATHTFNSACGADQRTGITAVEPGSGSTIMAYAGFCSPNNLQSFTDAQFHAFSIFQIEEYTRKGGGQQCGREIGSSNRDPSVSAGSDYTVPAITPFMLIANGSDSDGDTLSYTWEQSDTGTESDVDVDTGDNALIRSQLANIHKTRYIPNLESLFNRVGKRGERLPVNDRDMNFMVTARDGRGGLDFDEMKLKISGTGRTFSVTSHRFANTLFAGDQTTVTWDVAGTNLSPIDCHAIDIHVIQSDGTKQKLITTENDGEARFIVPKNIAEMSDARLMLSCRNNLFFNVSQGKLTVVNNSMPASSGGGSMGYFAPLLLIGLLRRRVFILREVK